MSDPFIIQYIRKNFPDVEVHVSTQGSTTNVEAVNYWKGEGVKRVVLARELSMEEIQTIIEKTGVDIEVFIHGAMCTFYSGRCTLSNYFTNRDSNRGGCSQVCRFAFDLESEDSQKLGLEIIKFMRERCDEYSKKYNLNFTCLATPAEGLSGRFTGIDRAIYGKIKGVTDREYYTNSFHVPVYYHISITDKIEKEAPYHALTNGGHISYIELDGDTASNVDAFERVIRVMKEAGIGYGAINHPVDRDPVCGYVGVINDVCPKCGRHEFEGVPMEKITSIDNNCCE